MRLPVWRGHQEKDRQPRAGEVSRRTILYDIYEHIQCDWLSFSRMRGCASWISSMWDHDRPCFRAPPRHGRSYWGAVGRTTIRSIDVNGQRFNLQNDAPKPAQGQRV